LCDCLVASSPKWQRTMTSVARRHPDHPVLQPVLVPGYDFTRNTPGIPSELADLPPATAAILTQSTAVILDKKAVVVLNQSTAAILDQSTAAILDTSKLPLAFGHGTMVAGIVHLAAPTASMMPLKGFQADGTASLLDIIRAVYYAVDNGARVINLSFREALQTEGIGWRLSPSRPESLFPVRSLTGLGETVAIPNDRFVDFLNGIEEIHTPYIFLTVSAPYIHKEAY
jgi:subtilisin family serine protease